MSSESFLRTDTQSGSGTRLEYEEILKKIGIKPAELKISACLNNTQSIIRAVGKVLGISFVSELAAKPFIMQKMITRINIGDMPERSFYIVLNKNCSVTPTSDAFIKFAQSYVHEHYGSRATTGQPVLVHENT